MYLDEEEEDFEEDPDINLPENVSKFLKSAEEGDLELIKKLIAEDSSIVSCVDSDGYSPLHRAAYSEKPETVTFLIENGANVNAETLDGWTPLHSASRWNCFECVKILLENGSNINAQTKGGQTPLHLASSERNTKETLSTLLLHKDIDITIKNSIGETALQISQRSNKYSYLFELTRPSINVI